MPMECDTYTIKICFAWLTVTRAIWVTVDEFINECISGYVGLGQ